MIRRLRNVFIHCSDSAFGEVRVIDQWHRERGWRGIGYHYVILNGRPYRDVRYINFLDGQVQPGQALNDDPIFEDSEVGAHVAGRNYSSLGVCLIGTTDFTAAQLLSAKTVCLHLVSNFSLTIADVLGHYEDPNTNKTCPNIPMNHFRAFLSGSISENELQERIAIYNHIG